MGMVNARYFPRNLNCEAPLFFSSGASQTLTLFF